MGQMIRVGASERDGYNLAAYGAIMVISCVALAVMVLYSIFAGPAFEDSAYGLREIREWRELGAAEDAEKNKLHSGAFNFHGAEAQKAAPVSGDREASDVTELEPHDTSDSFEGPELGLRRRGPTPSEPPGPAGGPGGGGRRGAHLPPPLEGNELIN